MFESPPQPAFTTSSVGETLSPDRQAAIPTIVRVIGGVICICQGFGREAGVRVNTNGHEDRAGIQKDSKPATPKPKLKPPKPEAYP